MQKMESLDITSVLLKWYASFLQGRQQSVRIGKHISQPLQIKGYVSQRALSGMKCFKIMIDDLKPAHLLCKYVDDSTISEIIEKSTSKSSIQETVNETVEWTKRNEWNKRD